MHRIFSTFCAALLLAFVTAAPAFAQTAEAPIERARAMIAEAGVGDLFEPAEDAESIRVRHAASGLICRFYGGEARTRIMTFDGRPRGDDVGCARDTDEQYVTLYATRYSPTISVQQALNDAEEAIRARFSDARPTPSLLSVSSEALPQPSASHFFVTIDGERWITSAIVAQSGDWIIKLRYSAPAPDDQVLTRLQLEAGTTFMLMLMDVAG